MPDLRTRKHALPVPAPRTSRENSPPHDEARREVPRPVVRGRRRLAVVVLVLLLAVAAVLVAQRSTSTSAPAAPRLPSSQQPAGDPLPPHPVTRMGLR